MCVAELQVRGCAFPSFDWCLFCADLVAVKFWRFPGAVALVGMVSNDNV